MVECLVWKEDSSSFTLARFSPHSLHDGVGGIGTNRHGSCARRSQGVTDID
jgi:hypothetical protein